MEERQKIMHFSKRGARGAIDLPVFYIMICPAFYTSKSVTCHSAPRTESQMEMEEETIFFLIHVFYVHSYPSSFYKNESLTFVYFSIFIFHPSFS